MYLSGSLSGVWSANSFLHHIIVSFLFLHLPSNISSEILSGVQVNNFTLLVHDPILHLTLSGGVWPVSSPCASPLAWFPVSWWLSLSQASAPRLTSASWPRPTSGARRTPRSWSWSASPPSSRPSSCMSSSSPPSLSTSTSSHKKYFKWLHTREYCKFFGGYKFWCDQCQLIPGQ